MIFYTKLIFIVCVSCVISFKIVNNTVNKIFGDPTATVSKFPPVIEFFVQQIQSQQSNYIHEDLSRPPTWDKPVYTLSPEDQILFSSLSSNTTTTSTTVNDWEYADLINTTEKLFEIISEDSEVNQTLTASNRTNVDEYSYVDIEDTTEKFFEIIEQNDKTTPRPNITFVYITPKPLTTKPHKTTEKTTDPELQLNITIGDSTRLGKKSFD